MPRDAAESPRIHQLQTSVLGGVSSRVFEFTNSEVVTAMVIGEPSKIENPLIRLHSRCLYGEVFGSLDCDCEAQLKLAFAILSEEGVGAFIYLEQEGRGSGLLNKADAYTLKDAEGLDTVEAYQKLGMEVDERRYVNAAKVIKQMGLSDIRLLTNNWSKVKALESEGVIVERVPLRTEPTPRNIDYLRVKQFKLGHDLGLE